MLDLLFTVSPSCALVMPRDTSRGEPRLTAGFHYGRLGLELQAFDKSQRGRILGHECATPDGSAGKPNAK